MGDLKSRLANARAKLLRRGSATSTSAISSASSTNSKTLPRASVSLTKLAEVSTQQVQVAETDDRSLSRSAELPKSKASTLPSFREPAASFETNPGNRAESLTSKDRQSQDNTINLQSPNTEVHCPAVTLEEPTPIPIPAQPQLETVDPPPEADQPSPLPTVTRSTPSLKPTPPGPVRRQSLVTGSNARVIKTLLESDTPAAPSAGIGPADYFASGPPTFNPGMLHRKIWVKRPNASATLVQIREDDLVDDVRDMILKKYANSLGRSFDAPDVILRIHPRENNHKSGDRVLGPEEEMCRTLDAYFPGGQTVNEALLIEVPQRRTPKPSPRAVQHGIPYYYDESRPIDNASEYFPPMPVLNPSPAALTANSHDSRAALSHSSHSIAVLQTGQLPPLPSPGSTRRGHHGRPKYPRHNTASPTTLTSGAPAPAPTSRPIVPRTRHDSSASETKHSATGAPSIPTPPAVEAPVIRQSSSPPTPRVSSPRPDKKRKKQKPIETPTLPAGLLDGSVPPINVLIVEDNIINLRVLGAFMERLKVRWQRAMNGKEAVTKWRGGGFHLVLMDIQLPIMNGLEATKEIRRLERVNSIGVFSSASSEAPTLEAGAKELKEEDKLADMSLFKSPVIIVALTASSLQSDRHEALAAGCNDFLTKPVNFVWLERKVKEWGCMQALIDFDGWRKWKDFAAQSDTAKNTSKLSSSYSKTAPRTKANLSPASAAAATNGNTNGVNATSKAAKKEEDKRKRQSLGVGTPVLEEKESDSPAPETNSSSS